MSSKDALKRKIEELKQQAEEIEELGVKLLEEAPTFQSGAMVGWGMLDYNSPLRPLQREVILKYQQWYLTSLQLVHEYIPEMVPEFKSYYSSEYSDGNDDRVIDFFRLGTGQYIKSNEASIVYVLRWFDAQLSILLSIPSVAEVKEMSLRELISADVARTEIEQAELLLENGFERAAGSIAGVALELHLKTLCDVGDVPYPLKPTIEPLVQVLYDAKKLDKTEYKYIQYLGSIRNKCSHSEPISIKEVQNLIDGVKKLI